MVRTSGVVTLVLVIASAIAIGTVVVRRALDGRVGQDVANCRGAVGIEVTGLSGAWRTRFAVPDHVQGAVIAELLPDGPAMRAGLRVGDVITAVNGLTIATACASEFALGRSCEPYDLEVYRGATLIQPKITPAPEAALFEAACEGGAHSACYRLAWLTWSGGGVPRDEARAMTSYREACRIGSGAACGELGRILSPEAERRDEALALLERGCALDDPQACLLYASALAMGTLAPRDDARATPIYEKACHLGSALGCYNTGLMYNEGRGVPVDDDRAFRAYAEGCSMGSSTACADEGFMRQHGRGVARDPALAVKLYERACVGTACQSGNLLGCLNLGRAYRDGIGVAADPARTAGIFRALCNRTLPPDDVEPVRQRARGCSLLGSMYLVGSGVERDATQGLAFSSWGCDQGDGSGASTLASRTRVVSAWSRTRRSRWASSGARAGRATTRLVTTSCASSPRRSAALTCGPWTIPGRHPCPLSPRVDAVFVLDAMKHHDVRVVAIIGAASRQGAPLRARTGRWRGQMGGGATNT